VGNQRKIHEEMKIPIEGKSAEEFKVFNVDYKRSWRA
jgi:hypothetical protein